MFAICVGGVVETLMERWERRMRVFKQYVKGLFPCLKNLLCILVLLTTQPPLLSSRDKLGFKYTCRRQPGVPHALTDMFWCSGLGSLPLCQSVQLHHQMFLTSISHFPHSSGRFRKTNQSTHFQLQSTLGQGANFWPLCHLGSLNIAQKKEFLRNVWLESISVGNSLAQRKLNEWVGQSTFPFVSNH